MARSNNDPKQLVATATLHNDDLYHLDHPTSLFNYQPSTATLNTVLVSLNTVHRSGDPHLTGSRQHTYRATIGDLNPLEVLHVILGHASEKTIKHVVRHKLVAGLKYSWNDIRYLKLPLCHHCMLGHMHRFPVYPSISTSTCQPRQCISMDVVDFGLKGHVSIDNYRYAAIFTDRASGIVLPYPLTTLSDTLDSLKLFMHHTGPTYYPQSLPVQSINFDSASNHLSQAMLLFLNESKIRPLVSPPYKHELNLVERYIQTIKNGLRTTLAYNSAPYGLWFHALSYYCHTFNRLAKLNAHKTRHETFTGEKPDMSTAVPFYAKGLAHVTKEQIQNHTFDHRAEPCRMIGYADAVTHRDSPQIGSNMPTATVSYKDSYIVLSPDHSRKIRSDCYFPLYTDGPSLLHEDPAMRPPDALLPTYDSTIVDDNMGPSLTDCAINSRDYVESQSPTSSVIPIESSESIDNTTLPDDSDSIPDNEQPELLDDDDDDDDTALGEDLTPPAPPAPTRHSSRTRHPNVTLQDATFAERGGPRINLTDAQNNNPPATIPHPPYLTTASDYTEDSLITAQSDIFSTANATLRAKLFLLKATSPPSLNKSKYVSIDRAHAEINAAISSAIDETPTTLEVPINMKQALSGTDGHRWKTARDIEMLRITSRNTYDICNDADQHDPSKKAIKSKYTFRLSQRPDGTWKYKVRLVACGYSQIPGRDYDETFAPTAKYQSVCTVLNIAAVYDWEVHGIDVENAFLESDLLETIYMNLPTDCYTHPDGKPVKVLLRKSLYGLKQAGERFYQLLKTTLIDASIDCTAHDRCVFTQKDPDTGDTIIVITYVDDIIITGSNPSRIAAVTATLHAAFQKINVDHEFRRYIGVDITRNHADHSITMTQAPYTKHIIATNLPANTTSKPLPLNPSTDFITSRNLEQTADPSLLPPIGQIRYLADRTRPELLAPLSLLSRHATQPTPVHTTGVKQIVRYLQTDPSNGITYSKCPSNEILLWGFADASYITHGDSHSQLGYCLFLNLSSGAICVRSSKDSTVSHSATEAEIKAIDAAIKEIVWFRGFLAELGFIQFKPTVLMTDSQSAKILADSFRLGRKTGHITMMLNYIHQEILASTIALRFIDSANNVADILTKNLPIEPFTLHCDKLHRGFGGAQPLAKPTQTPPGPSLATKFKRLRRLKARTLVAHSN